MRYEKGQKERTSRRIVEIASRRLREDGIAAAGMTGIMAEAGLTNGGFYAHFTSKVDLVSQALEDMMRDQIQAVEGAAKSGLRDAVQAYLNAEHRDAMGAGCPSAALLPEIARQDDALRATYTKHLDRMLDAVAALIDSADPAGARRKATAIWALLIGTLQMARAVSDPQLSLAILSDGLAGALALRDMA